LSHQSLDHVSRRNHPIHVGFATAKDIATKFLEGAELLTVKPLIAYPEKILSGPIKGIDPDLDIAGDLDLQSLIEMTLSLAEPGENMKSRAFFHYRRISGLAPMGVNQKSSSPVVYLAPTGAETIDSSREKGDTCAVKQSSQPDQSAHVSARELLAAYKLPGGPLGYRLLRSLRQRKLLHIKDGRYDPDEMRAFLAKYGVRIGKKRIA
jgi:hypothetical protein